MRLHRNPRRTLRRVDTFIRSEKRRFRRSTHVAVAGFALCVVLLFTVSHSISAKTEALPIFDTHVHSNARAVRTIFSNEPRVKILWAHAGMVEPPEVVAEMMDRYENLWTDISIREYDIAPQGKLDPAWRKLFLKHPDRITIGSDTWVTSRWGEYEQVLEYDRHWLKQLPRDVAAKIAYGNAARLFGSRPHTHLAQ